MFWERHNILASKHCAKYASIGHLGYSNAEHFLRLYKDYQMDPLYKTKSSP